MDSSIGQRQEGRLAYRRPIWFSEDLTKAVFLGLTEDISSGGMAFSCAAEPGRLLEGKRLTVRFSILRFDGSDTWGTIGVTRTGQVRSVTPASGGTYGWASNSTRPGPSNPPKKLPWPRCVTAAREAREHHRSSSVVPAPHACAHLKSEIPNLRSQS
jgi:hypothetical protein